ncbi:MAG: prolipoprotein diacylglyceryl transferase [Firmicutes bacterium HGW-Firmicutes-21]|nr:MAG: prolipoprotein diacylglyceryl transferase [Firmicutes bacterium HGW-Firmicutes-21]
MTNNHITFPGLGLEFDINPEAFKIGNISVQWYGIILCTGIIAAFLYFLRRASKTEGIDPDHVYNITLFAVVVAIIGARFMYVITNLDQYDTFLEMINIPGGGLAIYGGLIFGGASVIIYSRIKKLNTYALLDSMAPAVLIGQIIGRWGNFVNAEAYGYSAGVEKLPWRMGLDKVYIDDVYRSDIALVHPTFLYESLWNLVGFILITLAYKKKKFDGQILFYYVAWYGLGRGFIEMLRADSLRVLGLKLSVLIGFATFIIAIIFLIIRAKSSEKELSSAIGYESKYASVKIESERNEDIVAEPFETEYDEDGTTDDDTLGEQDSLDE